MDVVSIVGKKSFAAPGVYGYDAEAEVVVDDVTVYVVANNYDGYTHYTVSEKSIFAEEADDGEELEIPFIGDPDYEKKAAKFLGESTEEEYIEYYTNMTDAKGSKYKKVFETLKKVIDRIIEGA